MGNRRRAGSPGGSARARFDDELDLRSRRRREVAGWVVLAAAAGWWAAGQPGLVLAGRGPAWTRSELVAAAVGIVALALGGIRRPGRDPERWLRGAAGELATADLLDRLPRRWWVLHDLAVPGSRANVDHLVIGPRGVWAVDSKAYRSPLRAGLRSVRVGDRRLDTSPAAWEADAVGGYLGVEVRPLVVVHGDGLPRRGRRCDGVRVVPPDGLLRRLRRERVGRRLSAAERRAVWELAAEELLRS